MKEKGLIFGIFRPIDLIIFTNGIGISCILLMLFASLEDSSTFMSIVAVFPAIICTILVMPLKKHHNVLENIKSFIKK